MKHSIIIFLCGAVTTLMLLQFFNPSQGGPFVIFVLFLSLYVLLIGLLLTIANLLLSVIGRLSLSKDAHIHFAQKRVFYYSSILAVVPMFGLVAQAYDSISIFDIALVGVFILLALFYVEKRIL